LKPPSSKSLKSPERKQIVLNELPTWFTPPNKDRSQSRIFITEILAGIDGEAQSTSAEESEDEGKIRGRNCDEYGFVQKENKWYNIHTHQQYWIVSLFNNFFL
jgi:hypothetical protein